MKQYKYYSDITEWELINNVVLPCKNQDDMLCILIKNSEAKTVSNNPNTDNLNIRMNTVLSKEGKDYYFHIISSKLTDIFYQEQFNIIFEYLFKKIEKPISDSELTALIMSLEEFFRITPDRDVRLLQIGVYGELLIIKYLYECGYTEIVQKYHHNFYTKHDIEITDKLRIEIKTSQGNKRIHKFGHQQIYRPDLDLYVSSLLIEPVENGYSLFELFNDVIKLYANPDFILSLNKMMKRCNVNKENHGIQVSYSKAIDDIRIFDANNLPKIEIKEPNGVSNIYYDVDCSFAEGLEINEFIKSLRKLSNTNIYNLHDYSLKIAERP